MNFTRVLVFVRTINSSSLLFFFPFLSSSAYGMGTSLIIKICLEAHKMKRGYSFVDATSLPSANSLDHHAQLLNMSAMMKQFSEQMEFLRSSIEIQQHYHSGCGVEPVQERTDIAIQNALISTAELLPIQGPEGTIQWQNELYLPSSSSSDSQCIQISTPQPSLVRGMEESSYSALIGSQSRTTSSENSNHTTE